MLPYENRLRLPNQFRTVVASGQRVRRGCVVIHHVADYSGYPADSIDSIDRPIAGFVVGRTVGSSVVRHRVTRRLRAVMQSRLAQLPSRSATVVRALPAAAQANSATLARDLDAAIARLAPAAERSR